MLIPFIVLILSSILSASPLPAENEARCWNFIAPDSMFLLDEANPSVWKPITDNILRASQNVGVDGKVTNRTYTLVHFAATPYGITDCELHFQLPPDTKFLNYTGTHKINIKTTTGYFPPFRPTWDTIISTATGVPPTTLGTSLFGSVTAVPGVATLINSEACSQGPPPGMVGGGFGLGFVFGLDESVVGKSMIAFVEGDSVGPYLDYDC